jgi:CRISPR-associated endonuclease/helicase Cas3
MFGRNVIVSSATLPQPMASAIAKAWGAGFAVYETAHGTAKRQTIVVSDSLPPQTIDATTPEAYRQVMKSIAAQVHAKPVTKRARVIDVQRGINLPGMAEIIRKAARDFHEENSVEIDGKRLSIGLVRVANIKPCVEIAEKLRLSGEFHVCAYHARDLRIRRAHKEKHLSAILHRTSTDWIERLYEVEPWLREARGDVRLIVVATPVAEVGQDYDFDWAIIEPSSIHSIIQCAGRVNRHRKEVLAAGQCNIGILDLNVKAAEGVSFGHGVFEKPGLEIVSEGTHPTRRMNDLLKTDAGDVADVINAGLAFDEGGRKTQFAKCDEKAMSLRINEHMPTIERAPGMEIAFLAKEFETKNPLRAPNHTTKACIVASQDRDQFVFDDDAAPRSSSRPVRWINDGVAPEHVWLHLNAKTADVVPGDRQSLRIDVKHPSREAWAQEIIIDWHCVRAEGETGKGYGDFGP